MSECVICVSAYTAKKRKPVVCSACEFKCCASCVKTFLLSRQTLQTPCMNCFAPWSLEFLSDHLSRHWVEDTYQVHQENLLLEQQLGMLPLDMPLFQYYRKKKLAKTAYEEAKKLISGELAGHADALIQLNLLHDAANQAQREWQTELKLQHIPVHIVTRACPMASCRGFLDNKWSCYICQTQMCRECLVPLQSRERTPHVCLHENLQTVRLLQSETKECPGCAIPVLKVDGCSQMFCVQCKTPFSWVTGEIIYGAFHNPHFADYLRQASEKEKKEWNSRFASSRKREGTTGTTMAFTFQDIETLAEKNCRLADKSLLESTQYFTSLLSVLGFWEHSARDMAQADELYLVSKKRQFRLEYLNQEKTRESWKKALHRVLRASRRKMDLHHIYLSTCRETLDIVTQLLACPDEQWGNFLAKLSSVNVSYNKKIEKYNKWFKGRQLLLTSKFEFV